MALRPTEFASRNAGRVEFRSDPLRVRIELTDLLSADRHELRCGFEFSARVADQSADRQLFVELLMGDRPAVTREEVANHLRPAIEAAASAATSQRIETILSDPGKSAFLDSIRQAADAAAFGMGLIILPPFQLDLTSPTLIRQQRESAERARIEQQAAGRLDHLRRATELLKQFDSIRAASPSISVGQVLERIAPTDRGALLDAILASNADGAANQTLYAVAGSQLIRIDPTSKTINPLLIELPTTLGPLRSVQLADIDGQRKLLVGARTGVLVVDPQNPTAAAAYAVPDLNSSLGFNRAVYQPGSNSILATHGEAGLVQWNLDNPSAPTSRLRPADLAPQADGPLRNIHVLDRTLTLCTIGNCLAILDAGQRQLLALPSRAPIISIVHHNDRLFAIQEDSSVATVDHQNGRLIRTDSYGGSLCAAGALPWLDGVRLLLATSAGPIDCVGPDDSLVTRFNSAYRGLRHIAASPCCVAAVSPDRQRLVLWNSWDGRAPAHDLHLISLTRHRIADIAFA